MKCSQCGGTKFIKKDFLRKAKTLDKKDSGFFSEVNIVDETAQVFGYQIFVHGDAYGDMRIVGNCDTYVCEECGHVELFAKEFVDKVKTKEKVDAEIAAKKAAEDAIYVNSYNEAKEFYEKSKKKIEEFKSKINDDNITVREHKQSQEGIYEIGKFLSWLEYDLQHWNKDPKYYHEKWLEFKMDDEYLKYK